MVLDGQMPTEGELVLRKSTQDPILSITFRGPPPFFVKLIRRFFE
jgi:hypothetical protein